jgi:type IV fimbrial biogenesis protein FimT
MRRFDGFTLVEMLFVIVIVGIGMSIAVPSFQGMLQRNRLATQANDLTMAINLARSEASRLGKVVSLKAAVGAAGDEFGGGYCIVVGADPVDCDNTVVRRFPALQGTATLAGVDVDSGKNPGPWASPRDYIEFNSRGGLNEGGEYRYLDLCLEGQLGRRIKIRPTGRSKVHKEAEPGATPLTVQPDC